jgi:transcription antitermination factor NusG
MKTRSGANGGTFRVVQIKPRVSVALERIDEYLAGLSASDHREIVQFLGERTRRAEPLASVPDEIVEPKQIETDGLRWVVARVMPGTERRIARDLADEGFRPYCPLGRKLALRARVKGSTHRQRRMRPFVVFSPYLFVGCIPGREIGREIYDHWGERVGTVISDTKGPHFIAPRIIANINRLEVAGRWWDSWATQTRLRPGAQVLVTDGPFADMRGIVEALPGEMRVTVDLHLFGGSAPVTFDACQVGLV